MALIDSPDFEFVLQMGNRKRGMQGVQTNIQLYVLYFLFTIYFFI